ncbi:hypothetical protein MRB53_037136 [Persea americana]|nr:hypothetical protein MRB53_037136 [Persea americana]
MGICSSRQRRDREARRNMITSIAPEMEVKRRTLRICERNEEASSSVVQEARKNSRSRPPRSCMNRCKADAQEQHDHSRVA